MLWPGMRLAVGGVRGDITGMLPSTTSFIVPRCLQVCQQDLSHQDYSAVTASDRMVFQSYHGDVESFWCETPRVLTLLLDLTGAWLSKQRVQLQRKLSP